LLLLDFEIDFFLAYIISLLQIFNVPIIETPWTIDVKDIAKRLNTDVEKGLSSDEAKARLRQYGPNALEEKVKIEPIKIFLRQFKSFLVLILVAAAGVSAALGELLDASAIAVIVIINAVFGFVQEYRAEKAIEALRKMIVPQAVVIRDGRQTKIPASEIVPGDVVVLAAGDSVPADIRLVRESDLQTNEASLTGESTPVAKATAPLKQKELELGDKNNMTYLGTYVTTGSALGIVVATGMQTEMGKIATLVQEAPEIETPLSIKLAQLGKFMGLLVIAATAIVFITGIFIANKPLLEMFLVSVSLAVAAIPEGLPAVVTIGLAIGVQTMAKRNAIIRKLPAVETLGSATFICSDKTGTLTKNEMTVKKWWVDKFYDVSGAGYEPKGAYTTDGKETNPKEAANLKLAVTIGALCNDSRLEFKEGKGWQVVGDPTEGALLVAAEKAGLKREELEKDSPIVASFPFDSDRKRMSVVCDAQGRRVVYAKGGVEAILEVSKKILKKGRVASLGAEEKKRIMAANDEMAAQALRVLALAYKPIAKKAKYSIKETESELIFVGLVGMIDPPREEVKEALRLCKTAGIKVAMITGDHKTTAEAIAKELGLMEEGALALTGIELDKMSQEELEKVVENVRVYARIAPEHKKRIVEALQKKGHVVAVTGDGVNDAPALKKGDIGVSMGVVGTDVAKEASAMVLADDNFATLVRAVSEGRRIFDNIKRTVIYLMRGNIGEVTAVLFATLLWPAAPVILAPLQILWINLVTDGLPALGLGVEPAEEDVMQRPPRKEKHGIITRWNILEFTTVGLLTGIVTLLMFHLELNVLGSTPARAQSMALLTLVLTELMFALDMRSQKYSMFEISPLRNKMLSYTIIASLGLQIMMFYFPPFQAIFGTAALSAIDWITAAFAATMVVIIADIRKWLRRSHPTTVAHAI